MNLGNSYEYKKQCILFIHHDDQIRDAFFNNVMITGIDWKREIKQTGEATFEILND